MIQLREFTAIQWIAWNLMLAAIPVPLGYLIAAGIDRFTLRKHKIPWVLWMAPVIAWLAFLPNTCYLITEWRHFLFDRRFSDIRYANGDEPYVMLTVAKQGLEFLTYSAAGALCFALAIRPMHHVLRKAKFRTTLWAVPFFLLVSLGVYMGLIVRLNSWDLVAHPMYVARVVAHAFTVPKLLIAIVVFAALLWLLYLIIDVWFDGLKMRWSKAK